MCATDTMENVKKVFRNFFFFELIFHVSVKLEMEMGEDLMLMRDMNGDAWYSHFFVEIEIEANKFFLVTSRNLNL
jgi:hypothetical protein